ncbi:MAG: FAD-dependent monooxygenase [Pseudomonadota bacterium]
MEDKKTILEIHTDVLIVGAGPAGLALAVELGTQGHTCVIVERNDRVGYAPRAKTTNVRSRELFRRWGIAGKLAAESPFGVDFPSDVVFATRLGGHELQRFHNAFNCNPQRDERFSEHAQWIPQYKVEGVLKAHASELPGVQMLFATQLDDFREEGETVIATVSDVNTGELKQIRARYLVGADGARSTVRERLGIKMEGISPLSHNHNIIFRAPGLAQRHQLGRAVMYWLINQEVPSVLAPLDADDKWTFGCPKLADASAEPADLIRKALGFDIDIEILSRDEWTAHQLIAQKYSKGRVFLVGDACHLHPPFGGYGMNMGIGDAVDLGWKLSAVLSGWGGENLLVSYEIERRQIHHRVIDESVANHAFNSKGLVVPGLEDEGDAGKAIRLAVAATIQETKRREFHSLGVVLGSRYLASPCLVQEEDAVTAGGSSEDYVPSARPGCLAPHFWLEAGRSEGASLYDHFSTSGLTLLVTTQGAANAVAPLVQAAAGAGIPLKVLVRPLKELHELYGCALALIRPDQYVAWRGNNMHEASDALATIAGKSLEAIS